MWLKYFFISLIFFIASLLQSSLLPYFIGGEILIDFVFILFFILIFFDRGDRHDFGFWVAILSGFFLDIFMPFYFGISIISLIIIYFLEKLAINFLKDNRSRRPIFLFSLLFLSSFLTYKVFLYLASILFNFQLGFSLNSRFLFAILLNLFVALAGFYIYGIFVKDRDENQLKLL